MSSVDIGAAWTKLEDESRRKRLEKAVTASGRLDNVRSILDDEGTSYGLAALGEECSKLASTREGFRDKALYDASLKLFSLEAAGELSSKAIYDGLTKACEANGYLNDHPMSRFHQTMASASKTGKRNPRYPAERETGTPEPAPKLNSKDHDWELSLQWADTIEAKQKDWLWPGVLPNAEFTILGGEPGIGKSFIMISTAAKITTGSAWPTSKDKAPLGRVLYLSTEDGAADTLKPRLLACGADPSRVAILGTLRKGEAERQFSLKDDLPRLRTAIEGVSDLRLVVVDTIGNHMGGADRNKAEEVRAITTQLTAIARDYGIAVVGITHLNKSREGSALQRIMGSTDWSGAARAVWIVDREDDSESGNRRKMTPAKINHAGDTTGYAYTLEPRAIAFD